MSRSNIWMLKWTFLPVDGNKGPQKEEGKWEVNVHETKSIDLEPKDSTKSVKAGMSRGEERSMILSLGLEAGFHFFGKMGHNVQDGEKEFWYPTLLHRNTIFQLGCHKNNGYILARNSPLHICE